MGRGGALPLCAGASCAARLTQAPAQGRLLGYGTITFADAGSVARVLQAAHQARGMLRIPYAAPPRDPAAIAYASLADSARALATAPSVRETVTKHAPLAAGVRSTARPDDAPDCFYVTVERSEAPAPPASRAIDVRQLQAFGGFSDALARDAARYAREDKPRRRRR